MINLKKKQTKFYSRIFWHFPLVGLSFIFSFPLVWMILCSLKPNSQILQAPYSFWPEFWRWQNYPQSLTFFPFLLYLSNTILISFLDVSGTVLSCSLVAYGFARLSFRGREGLFFLLLATLVLPFHVTMIPRFLIFKWLHLYDHFGALYLPSFLGNAFYIFLLRQFFQAIPEDLSEAARIDGCSEWRIFWKIILPLAKPALATVALMEFISSWNDFSGPLLYLSDQRKYTLAFGLQQFISAYGSEWALLMAATTLFTLPVIVLFFLTQKTFIQGISTSGLKG